MEQFDKNINDKNIVLKFSLGEITLRKPSKWNLKSLKDVTSKSNLPKNDFLKFVIFYSQNNIETKNYSMAKINALDSEEINSLFKKLINSDKDLLKSLNVDDHNDDDNEVYKILINYLTKCALDMIAAMSALALQTSIHMTWIDALNGKLDDESKKLSDLSSFLKQLSQHSSVNSKAIDSLKEFDDYKADFMSLCNAINALIKKIRSFELWIPSRYSIKIIQEILSLDFTKLDREQTEMLIIRQVNHDIDKTLFPDWKTSDLFNGREIILKDAFSAHKQKLFSASITTFLTQLDHIILQISKLLNIDSKKRNANYNMLDNICDFIENRILPNMPITYFLNYDLESSLYLFQLKSFVQYLRDIFKDTNSLIDQVVKKYKFVMLNLFQHLMNLIGYEILKQVQGDKKRLLQEPQQSSLKLPNPIPR